MDVLGVLLLSRVLFFEIKYKLPDDFESLSNEVFRLWFSFALLENGQTLLFILHSVDKQI